MKETLQQAVTLTGFSEQDMQILKKSASKTQKWADFIVKEFYDTLFAYGPTAGVFKEGERPDRETTLRNWYLEVTSGNIDDKFWRHQWFVGLIHIKRRVSNNFMLGMTSRVQQLFLTKCMEDFTPKEAIIVFGAFKRVTDVVATLIADGYFINYVESLENVLGFKRALVEVLLDMEIDKRIAESRPQK
ncbi:MAG: protoglobin domain-containing protein [candidate division KSB1 bacterium]|nr:protoglobin domain-containing protein [candidate division KSB1 bacterium]MDZ7275800.1 protoglobin domain-containing protein [candidate division KSB1 bacterium]MDZ7287552.1 protoglobin domain-containing protein [candidate division KSB1 bacterium]MDZ7308044.1 protoglobin domain-containing protein [candidate division KSB1 bacterium]MDZ7350530.1 protoglobin domain-containing protein [candidate division KSB1 bacterium]